MPDDLSGVLSELEDEQLLSGAELLYPKEFSEFADKYGEDALARALRYTRAYAVEIMGVPMAAIDPNEYILVLDGGFPDRSVNCYVLRWDQIKTILTRYTRRR